MTLIHTCILDVGKYHTHRTAIKYPLDESITALMRYTYERRNACQMPNIAKVACLG